MITRFAPSPTGPLHLGHAYSAILAHDMAMRAGGRFLLRIEDIDRMRARPEWEKQIFDDLKWLGLSWETPVLRQSEHLNRYREIIDQLWWHKFLYACTCNRRDISNALSAPQEGVPIHGADGLIYPGTCRNDVTERDHYPIPAPNDATLRLDWSMYTADMDLGYVETGSGTPVQHSFTVSDIAKTTGDIVIARKDFGTSYHLSVVLDDALQGVTHVVRGEDLRDATPIHVALQRLFGLPTPTYHHHRLIRDDTGKRLAKRDDARAISKYRAEGHTAEDIRNMVGLPAP